jgi:hypothetical protein
MRDIMFIAGEKLVFFMVVKLLLILNIFCDFKAAMVLYTRIIILSANSNPFA